MINFIHSTYFAHLKENFAENKHIAKLEKVPEKAKTVSARYVQIASTASAARNSSARYQTKKTFRNC